MLLGDCTACLPFLFRWCAARSYYAEMATCCHATDLSTGMVTKRAQANATRTCTLHVSVFILCIQVTVSAACLRFTDLYLVVGSHQTQRICAPVHTAASLRLL